LIVLACGKGLATSRAVEIPALFGLVTPNQGRRTA
jgi:hypothetical protein